MAVPNIPQYKHLKMWKKGGMGVLFRGEDEKTDDEIVIKMMRIPETEEELQQLPQMSGLFKSETEIPLTVKHDHILGAIAHGFVMHEGYSLPYLVYPYIKNGSLQDLMNKEQPWNNPTWSLLQIVDIVVQAAEGLSYLHSQQPIIAHLDVKPGNFLWRPEVAEGDLRRVHLWLSDFGTARWEKDASYITTPIGTLSYMAPEQFKGQIAHTADQYALAIVARYLLTGSPPPQAKNSPPNPSKLRNPPPSRLNPDRLHLEKIDAVLLQALADNPEERFRDVLDFAVALKQAVLQQEQTSSYSASMQLFSSSSFQDARRSLEFYNAHTEPFSVANQLIDNGQIQPQDSLAFPEKAIEPLHEHHTVDQPAPSPVPRVTNSPTVALPYFPLQAWLMERLPDRPTMLSWSADGQYLVCGFYEDALRLMHVYEHIETLPIALHGHLVCWSPGGRFLAISVYNRNTHQAILHLWDRATPTIKTLVKVFRCDTPIDGLAWSIHGQLAVWLNTELLFYNIPEESQLLQFPPNSRSVTLPDMECGNIGTLQWSPDGSLLAAGARNGTLFIWNAASQQIQTRKPDFKERIYSLTWFPDSTLLAVAYRNRTVVFWNVAAERALNTWKELPGLPMMLSLLPHTLTVTVATQSCLLFGSFNEDAPSTRHPGQLLASWSTTSKLAALDEYNDTTLVIWQH